jgi:hypothetical protein
VRHLGARGLDQKPRLARTELDLERRLASEELLGIESARRPKLLVG